MIFVTVGTNEARFDRLLRWLDAIPEGEEVVAQYGPSAVRVPGGLNLDYLPFEELVAHVRAARKVITHAGVGSIMVALANGKRPLVVPRRASLREAVDDHQAPLARRMEEAGLVTVITSREHLGEMLAATETASAEPASAAVRLSVDLRGYLAKHVG